MSKQYSLEKSPLYRLRNRRKLAERLLLEPRYFNVSHDYIYNEFERRKSDGGVRHFAEPPHELKRIQKRIHKLMQRIETPEWVKAGKSCESYVTNCKMHLEAKYMRTMDISKFYDSVQYKYVYETFLYTFFMEPDIARLMAKIVTHERVLPTGSPSSQLIIYWAYKDMFDEVHEIAKRYHCIFSLYVDDMTFSSQHDIPYKMREEVANTLKKYGLHAKRSKDHYYKPNDLKIATGCGIKEGKLVVLNHQRVKIINQYRICTETDNIKDIEQLQGMLCSARQIEPQIFPSIYAYLKKHEDRIKKYRKEQNRKKKNRYSKRKR